METQLLRARICRAERMDRCVQESFEPGGAAGAARRAAGAAPSGHAARRTATWGRRWRPWSGRATSAPRRACRVGLRYGRLLSRRAGPRSGGEGFDPRWSGEALPQAAPTWSGACCGREKAATGSAAAASQQAVGEDPKSRMAHFHLGMAWFRLGNLDAAEEELREADRLDVSDPRPLAALCAMPDEGRPDGRGRE